MESFFHIVPSISRPYGAPVTVHRKVAFKRGLTCGGLRPLLSNG